MKNRFLQGFRGPVEKENDDDEEGRRGELGGGGTKFWFWRPHCARQDTGGTTRINLNVKKRLGSVHPHSSPFYLYPSKLDSLIPTLSLAYSMHTIYMYIYIYMHMHTSVCICTHAAYILTYRTCVLCLTPKTYNDLSFPPPTVEPLYQVPNTPSSLINLHNNKIFLAHFWDQKFSLLH